MAINLKSTRGIHNNGVKLLVYGNSGSGKTSLIPTLPNPVVLSAEGGLLSIADADVPFVEVSSYDTLMEAYAWLTQ
jgi:polynucleotide 5'-kinase involved in rRNA processing